jgi:pSer/pThr/pTyr-binding forkhead associated (FHA) protein
MAGWLLESGDPRVIMRLPPGTTRTVGRTPQADFVLDAPLISRLHCRLTVEPSDQLVVQDLGSTNGTHVNGRRVDRATLRNGDQLSLGRVTLVVKPQDE